MPSARKDPSTRSRAGTPPRTRRRSGRPSDGPLAHGTRLLKAVALYEQLGASEAARRLGVSRRTIYNLLEEHARRLNAAGGSRNKLTQAFYERQDNWEAREKVRIRQQRFRERRKEGDTSTASRRGKRVARAGRIRVPEYLQERFNLMSRVRMLCPTLMQAMRHDAARQKAAFSGWDDEQVAALLFRAMRWKLIAEASELARALCTTWGLQQNAEERWMPALATEPD